jgi:UDP-3-O-[3-hydroxymyristoyl] glucosamine N-acyltransferase
MLLTYATDRRFADIALNKENISAVFMRVEDVPEKKTDATMILAKDPQAAFFRFHNYLAKETDFFRLPKSTMISPNTQIHPSAVIADKDVIINDDVTIGPNVVLLEGTTIERGVEISPGAVLGVSGARIINPKQGKPFRVVHVGGVLIREDAFLGANCVIVRSVWRKMTIIGKNVFVGNLVNIGHNVVVDDDSMILPGSILCGSSQIGEGVVISPGAIVANQKQVGRNAWVTLGAVATQDVEPGQRVSGNFAIEHNKLLEHIKRLSNE